MPGIQTTGALHKGERHKSFPERLGPGYRPPMPCKRVSVHSAFNEGAAMPESMPRQSRATKHFGPLRDHCRLEPIPITLWDRPVSECVRTRSPTHSNGPIGDASRPMIESSCEIRRESQKKLDSAATVPRIAKQLLTGLPLKLIHTHSPLRHLYNRTHVGCDCTLRSRSRGPAQTHGARSASNGAWRRPRIARTESEQARR